MITWDIEQLARGKVLRSLRKDRQLTQANIEEQTGITISHLSQVEQGLKGLHEGKLSALLAVFGLEKSEFMRQVETVAQEMLVEETEKKTASFG